MSLASVRPQSHESLIEAEWATFEAEHLTKHDNRAAVTRFLRGMNEATKPFLINYVLAPRGFHALASDDGLRFMATHLL